MFTFYNFIFNIQIEYRCRCRKHGFHKSNNKSTGFHKKRLIALHFNYDSTPRKVETHNQRVAGLESGGYWVECWH